MATYTYIGGPLGSASSYTVGGSTPMNPPGTGDTIDFPSGGAPTGAADVSFVSVEGALTLTGDLQTMGVTASAPITINAGGDLDSSAAVTTTAAMTVQNGGMLEGDGSDFSGPTFTVDGNGSSYTDTTNFQAGPGTAVTFSNGAQVMTRGRSGRSRCVLWAVARRDDERLVHRRRHRDRRRRDLDIRSGRHGHAQRRRQ